MLAIIKHTTSDDDYMARLDGETIVAVSDALADNDGRRTEVSDFLELDPDLDLRAFDLTSLDEPISDAGYRYLATQEHGAATATVSA